MADSPFSPEDSFISIVYFCGAVLCNLLIFFSRTTHVGSHHPWLLAQHICFSFHVQIAAKSCKFELFDNTELTTILFHQYGKDYEYDAPVKLLDKHLHAMAQSPDEQLVVVSQVSSSFCTNLCFYVINEMANLSCFYLELGIYYFIIWQFFEKNDEFSGSCSRYQHWLWRNCQYSGNNDHYWKYFYGLRFIFTSYHIYSIPEKGVLPDRINCTTPVHILNDADQNWLSPTAVIYIS